MEAGVDSLAATELSSRLRALTGMQLSPTIVFEQPTARALRPHLVELMTGEERSGVVTGPQGAGGTGGREGGEGRTRHAGGRRA